LAIPTGPLAPAEIFSNAWKQMLDGQKGQLR
jgi:hypothetical protein